MNIHNDPRIAHSAASAANLTTPQVKTKNLQQLRQSTREFEALYIFEVYKSMRQNVPDGGLIEKSFSTELFQEMLDMELARTAAAGEGMGIGKKMYEQLKDHIK
jgi:peptidoglycan hydrolase FlgJ